jgi:hypothetical protein
MFESDVFLRPRRAGLPIFAGARTQDEFSGEDFFEGLLFAIAFSAPVSIALMWLMR